MSLDIIHPGRDADFVETWADRKARRAAERVDRSGLAEMTARVCAGDASKPGPKPVHSAALRAAILLGYGAQSATILAHRHGVSKGMVTRTWAEGRRLGIISPAFEPFGGRKARPGRLIVRGGRSGHAAMVVEGPSRDRSGRVEVRS